MARILPPGTNIMATPKLSTANIICLYSLRDKYGSPRLLGTAEKPPLGPQWLHEIKLDGYRMAARVENGRVQLLTRTGLDWANKYPLVPSALSVEFVMVSSQEVV
jgi:hypothetical protein